MKNILLVDDDKILLKITTKIIERLHYNVLPYLDSFEAGQAVDNIDLIITDLNMPKMGGIKLIQEIQKKSPATPAIILSGLIDDSIIEGVDFSAPLKMCQKPLKIEELHAVIIEMIGEGE